MNHQSIKRKIKQIVTGLTLTGQILVSTFSPLLAQADTLFPEKVTIEYSMNQIYQMNGSLSDGTPFQTQTAPLFATYDGKRQPVFCIEPGMIIDHPSTSGYTSNPLPDIANKTKTKYISTLWKYAGTDADTQMVGQSMMWQEVNGVAIDSITRPDGTPLTNYQSIKEKINKLVDEYAKKPSFHDETIKLTLGESLTLTDTANANLSAFDKEELNSANVDYVVDGNNLTITPRADSKTNGVLRLFKSTDVGTPVAYKLADNQTVMAGAIDEPNLYQLNVEVETNGEVKIIKLDKNTGKAVPNTEFTVSFDGKSQTVKTNEKGEAFVKEIPHDTKVTVTETFVPSPYVLDKNNTQEVIVQAGKTASVEFKNDVTTGKTTLTKLDATTESATPLNPNYPMVGAKYGLFKADGTLLKEFTLDKTLTATMENLALGTYKWKETVAPIGYTLDPTEHVVELTYKDQLTTVVAKDTRSTDDVIRMDLDGQKLIQNETNELFKNGVEFTLTNKRTGETHVVTTETVDGKKGYFRFADIAIDDYVLTETKGVDGYKNIDPIELTHVYDEKTDAFTFVVKDQKSNNVLNEETVTQVELSKGKNVDLGTYTLKDKALLVEEPEVGISTKAHTGDGKTNTFVWGEDIQFYDDVTITHENIPTGTERAYETILVAITPDDTETDVWSSGKVDYTVTDKEMTERVLAEYDYKKDKEGTRYYFKEAGYSKPSTDDYEKDTEHNFDGKDKEQDITPKDAPKVGISTKAHTGDGKTNTFVWREDVQFYDDVTLTHENIPTGTERAYETILVAVTPDGTETDVWSSGKVDYTVTDKEVTERVLAEYDYKKDRKGTRYYFKEVGYSKPSPDDYEKDTEHNFDGKDKEQDITPTVKETSKDIPKAPETPKGTFPQTGEISTKGLTWFGIALLVGTIGGFYYYKKKQSASTTDQSNSN